MADTVERGMESIAIVGLAGRFPGASDVATFWRNVRDGVESIADFSDQELRAAGVTPDLLADPNYVKRRGILQDTELFDAALFGYSRREAELMDPQHRVFLECAWEALEHAGYAGGYDGVAGIFAGAGLNTYLLRSLTTREDADLSGSAGFQTFIASDKDFLATRVAYKLNLKGPALAVQTACSTSLVAVVLACQSLLSYQCDLALAGGVAIDVPQKAGYLYQEGMILAPDGHCRPFDARAAGTVPGSGAGIVVLRRLSDALADGDTIYAVIRGSAINNDGSSKAGFTAPSVDGQAEVIALAHALAAIEPESITYVEAHGTGTPLGDPIEVAALTEAFRAGTSARGFCAIGSVKSNIGHLDTAAGVAGLIKTVLALHHRLLPATLHYTQPNPQVAFEDSPFYVNTRTTEWKAGRTPRRAGVSSFGIGGTNAHVVLEEAPEARPRRAAPTRYPDRPAHILVLSARDETALQELAERYRRHFTTHPALSLADACFTAGAGRAHLPHRLAIVARTADEAGARLAVGDDPKLVSPSRSKIRISFLFTGQGAQYPGMGRQLYETQPVFRDAVDRCGKLLAPLLDRSLHELLYPEPGAPILLDETAYTQPALFAVEWALAELWRSWGIRPAAVLGHSIGEYVAACVAGALSLEDALKLVTIRGRLMSSLPRDGAMAAVFAPEERIAPVIASYNGRVALAAINGPDEVVVSGEAESVHALAEELRPAGIRSRSLPVSHAFHSALMDPILDDLERSAREVVWKTPDVDLVSNVTGRIVDAATLAQPSYWRDHARSPVRFADGVRALHALGCEIFLEIGPKPTLLSMARRCVTEDAALLLPSLREGHDDWEQMLKSLGALYTAGADVEWEGFDRGYERRRVPLPTYPFQRKRYWIEPAPYNLRASRRHVPASGSNPLLGRRLHLALRETVFEAELQSDWPLLSEHRYYGLLVVPAVAFLSMALSATDELCPEGTRPAEPGALPGGYRTLRDVMLLQALVLESDAGRAPGEGSASTVQLVLTPTSGGEATFQILSLDGSGATPGMAPAPGSGTWTLHVTGTIAGDAAPPASAHLLDTSSDLAAELRCDTRIAGERFYEALRHHDLALGPGFRWLEQIELGQREAVGHLRCPHPDEQPAHITLMGILEAGLQLLSAASAPGLAGGVEVEIYVPIAVESLRITAHIASACRGHARIRESANGSMGGFTGDVDIVDARGSVVARIEGVRYRRAERSALERLVPRPQVIGETDPSAPSLYQVEWRPVPLPVYPSGETTPPRSGFWLLFADRRGVATALIRHLEQAGERCLAVYQGETSGPAGTDSWQLNPALPDDMTRLAQAILRTDGEACLGIVHLWSLDAPAGHGPAEEIGGAQMAPLQSMLHLVKAVAGAGAGPAPRLWIVTGGAQAVEPEGIVPTGVVAPLGALLWGLGRTLALEQPELWGGLVDLDPERPDDCAAGLAAQLRHHDAEDQTAFRIGGHPGLRYGARLVRREAMPGGHTARLRDDATYLITGGLGELGLCVARWMAAAPSGHGARHIVLAGRRGPSAGAATPVADAVAAIESMGAKVTLIRCDVSQVKDVADMLARIAAGSPPLRGIVHAAGLLDDGTMLLQDWSRFTSVLAPKVAGAWNLHQATRNLPLDFFVLFSSAAALLGSPGQGSYAAANAFLDALAHERRAQGLPATSIAWGPWAEVGMAARAGEPARRRRVEQGIGDIRPADGLQVLEQLLQQQQAQVGVLPIEWSRYRQAFPAAGGRAFLSELMPATGRALGVADRPPVDDVAEILRRLETASARQRQELLQAHVEAQVARVLGAPRSGAFDPQLPLHDAGLDSLMAIELRNALGRSLGRTLPATLIFDYPTLAALAGYLARELFARSAPDRPQSGGSGQAHDEEPGREALDQLSQADVEALLDAKLAMIDEWMEGR